MFTHVIGGRGYFALAPQYSSLLTAIGVCQSAPFPPLFFLAHKYNIIIAIIAPLLATAAATVDVAVHPHRPLPLIKAIDRMPLWVPVDPPASCDDLSPSLSVHINDINMLSLALGQPMSATITQS